MRIRVQQVLGFALAAVSFAGPPACSSSDDAAGSNADDAGDFEDAHSDAGDFEDAHSDAGDARSSGGNTTSTGGTSSTGGAPSTGGSDTAPPDGGTDASEPDAAEGGGGDADVGDAPEPPKASLFVPQYLEVVYAGKGDSHGLSIVALTLADHGAGPVIYSKVQNAGTDIVCIVDTPMDFFDGSGTKLGSTFGAGSYSSGVYISFGSASQCIGPGESGMAEIQLNLSAAQGGSVRRIEYGITGNINNSATAITTPKIKDLVVVQAYDDHFKAVGTLVNTSGTSIKNPEIEIYAVDAKGRPYGKMWTFENAYLFPDNTLQFDTVSMTGIVQATVSFVDFDLP